MSFDSHTTLNKILAESLSLNNFFHQLLMFTITPGRCKLITLVEFGNCIKWDSISNVIFFLFYILGDRLITIDTDELLWSKNSSIISGWKFCRNCLKRATDFETDNIREVDNLYNTTEGKTDAYLLEDEFKKTEAHGNLNESFEVIVISPMKFHGIPQHAKVSVAKKKIQGVVSLTEEKVNLKLFVYMVICIRPEHFKTFCQYKINVKFCFHTPLWYFKCFYEGI